MLKIDVNQEEINCIKVSGSADDVATELAYIVGIIYAFMEKNDEDSAQVFKKNISRFGNQAFYSLMLDNAVAIRGSFERVFGDRIEVNTCDASE